MHLNQIIEKASQELRVRLKITEKLFFGRLGPIRCQREQMIDVHPVMWHSEKDDASQCLSDLDVSGRRREQSNSLEHLDAAISPNAAKIGDWELATYF
jgi:hypothetical protein